MKLYVLELRNLGFGKASLNTNLDTNLNFHDYVLTLCKISSQKTVSHSNTHFGVLAHITPWVFLGLGVLSHFDTENQT